jgi:hypothetical protein
VTTTEETAEPTRLFQDGELPGDPTREPQPGDWFAMHLVCRADGKVEVTADTGQMPVATILAALKVMAKNVGLDAKTDMRIRDLAAEGQGEFDRLVAEGMSPRNAKGVALLDIIKKIHTETDDKKNDNGGEASSAS